MTRPREPPMNVTCFKYQQLGHYARECPFFMARREPPSSTPRGNDRSGGGGEQENYHVTLISNEVARGGPLIQVNGVMLDCFIDTGSEITLFKDTKKEGKFKICGAIFSSYEWGIWTIFQIY